MNVKMNINESESELIIQMNKIQIRTFFGNNIEYNHKKL